MRALEHKKMHETEREKECVPARLRVYICEYVHIRVIERKMQGGEGVSEERSQNWQAQHRLQCLGVRVLEDVVPASRRKGKL